MVDTSNYIAAKWQVSFADFASRSLGNVVVGADGLMVRLQDIRNRYFEHVESITDGAELFNRALVSIDRVVTMGMGAEKDLGTLARSAEVTLMATLSGSRPKRGGLRREEQSALAVNLVARVDDISVEYAGFITDLEDLMDYLAQGITDRPMLAAMCDGLIRDATAVRGLIGSALADVETLASTMGWEG